MDEGVRWAKCDGKWKASVGVSFGQFLGDLSEEKWPVE